MSFILKERHRDILKKSNEIGNKVKDLTLWKVWKYGVFFCPYFAEKSPYSDTFYTVAY